MEVLDTARSGIQLVVVDIVMPFKSGIEATREIPDQHKTAVASLAFHPQYPVLLSASAASVLFLHHIAPDAHPTPNPRLTSVQARQVDVRRAAFLLPQGDRVFFAGRRRYLQQWDLPSGLVQRTSQVQGHEKEHKTMEQFRLSPCGRYIGIIGSGRKGGGVVSVLNTATMQWVASARMTSRNGIADFAWWRSGDGLSILGRDGQIGEYSVESRKFVGTWTDEGSVGSIAIALGGSGGPSPLGGDRWIATGSNSGITNVYERVELLEPTTSTTAKDGSSVTLKPRPEPRRVFDQLVTPITFLEFSPDGQLFAFASQDKRDALKIVHLPSCTIYKNWPTNQTPLGRVTAVAFGRQSDILAVGNDTGKIRLWQIRN
jgi:WD40 repeat protein